MEEGWMRQCEKDTRRGRNDLGKPIGLRWRGGTENAGGGDVGNRKERHMAGREVDWGRGKEECASK